MRTQTEQNERTLEEVAPGERGVILQVGNENGPVKRRLVDMGLTPGTEVTVRKVAPFGDPGGAQPAGVRAVPAQSGRGPDPGWQPARRGAARPNTAAAHRHGAAHSGRGNPPPDGCRPRP
ncbi:MAG: FeoA family protein [Flavonifractor plautii]